MDPGCLGRPGLGALLKGAALAVGSQTSEEVAPVGVLGSPQVLVAVGLALTCLVLAARRGIWLPLCVVISVLLSVSLLNSRVEPWCRACATTPPWCRWAW